MVEVGLADSDLADPGFSDSGFAALGMAGLGFEPLYLAVADSASAKFAPAAGSVDLVPELRLPGAGMLWRWREEKAAGPKHDYSEGA